jgi:hypothetical protein
MATGKKTSASLTPTDDRTGVTVTVKPDEYYVVVGFEVNNPLAFVDDVQDLGVHSARYGNGFGHAFYYVVKNKKVSKFFSFGPSDEGKIGWNDKGSEDREELNKYDRGAFIKDGRKNARQGTPDYAIEEVVTAFKIPLTPNQGVTLENKTEEMRQKIITGKQKYTVYMNDTCAETARDLIVDSGIDTPDGSGWVKHGDVAKFPLVKAVNPYMWHKNFTKTVYKKAIYKTFKAKPVFVNGPDRIFL